MDKFMQKWVKTSKESSNDRTKDENKIKLNSESQHDEQVLKSPDACTSGTSQRSLNTNNTPSSSVNSIDEEMLDKSCVDSTEKTSKRYMQRINLSKLKDKFSWLDKNKSFLFCKTCNLKISGQKFHLKRHEESLSHQRSTRSAQMIPQINTTILVNPAKQKMENQVKEAELRISAYLCEHNLAFLLSDTLPPFLQNIFPDSAIAPGIKMKRKKATQLVGVIAPYFKQEIAIDLRINMFSIIIDETTDISTKKSLILVVRYWKNGMVQDRIFDLIEVRDASAQGIFNSLKHVLDSYQIPYKNLLGIAADNASTMMGHLNGVQAKLRDISPHIYVQRCASHSLHLCSSAAAKKLPDNVEQFTRDVYAYFSHSSKRQEELEECQVFVRENPTKMLYPSQTRWLSLRAVVNRILDHWNSLTLFFTRAALEGNLPTAKSILGALKNDIYKIYLLFLSYVLELVTKVNLEFQSEQPKLPIFLERMTALYKIILKGFIKKHILDTVPLTSINVGHPNNYLELNQMIFGAKVDALLKDQKYGLINKDDVHNFRLKALEFYIELAKQIKERFNFEDKILKYASNFTPQKALSGEILSIGHFVNLFPNVTVDIEAANIEWLLISEIANNFIDLSSDLNDICKFWGKIEKIKNSLNEDMFSNLMKLVKIILSLPHSSAAAERGFSDLASAKTKLRNRLLISTCSAILILKDGLRKIEGGSLSWRPPLSMLNFNSQVIEKINIEE